jgi:hypothetical protein
MIEDHGSDMLHPGWWTRVAMAAVRVALLAFLIWTLFSARFASETPVAEDVPSTPQNSRTTTAPCPTESGRLG